MADQPLPIVSPQERHADIISRLEKATGPDVDLNADILLALGWTTRDGAAFDPSGNRALTIPDLVGSLDAALALVGEKLPGTHWLICTSDDQPGMFAAILTLEGGYSYASTPSLAVLLALFRSLEEE